MKWKTGHFIIAIVFITVCHSKRGWVWQCNYFIQNGSMFLKSMQCMRAMQNYAYFPPKHSFRPLENASKPQNMYMPVRHDFHKSKTKFMKLLAIVFACLCVCVCVSQFGWCYHKTNIGSSETMVCRPKYNWNELVVRYSFLQFSAECVVIATKISMKYNTHTDMGLW